MPKERVIEALGEQPLLLPGLVSEALRANDRVKYLLTLLQDARAAADRATATGSGPPEAVSSLREERLAAGIEDAELDRVISGASREHDGYRVPGAESIAQGALQEVRTMLVPLSAASPDAAAELRGRAEAVSGALSVSDDRISADDIARLTAPRSRTGDSLHVIVMDAHRELNALQARLATESVDGAHAYDLAPGDREVIRAFMRGLHRTERLRLDHPGLQTTATRSEQTLLMQNDLGTTEAHVVVIRVTGLVVTVTYTDVHLQRLLFFQDLLTPWRVSWEDTRSRSDQAIEGLYHLASGRLQAHDRAELERFLEHLGSRLVFIIDWNRARKRLRRLVGRRAALELLRWAAEHDYGHIPFLRAGGDGLIYDALQFAGGRGARAGESLQDVLGSEAAQAYLRSVLRICSEGLVAGRAVSLVQDEVRAELTGYLRSARQEILALALRHAELSVEIAELAREALEQAIAGADERRRRAAAQAQQAEHEADALLTEARTAAARSPELRPFLELVEAADDIADCAEEAAFYSTLLPSGQPVGEVREQLRRLAQLVLAAAREYLRAVGLSAELRRGGPREDMDACLRAAHQAIALEHDTDDAQRAVHTALTAQRAQDGELFVIIELTRSFEEAADALMHSAHLLREHALARVAGSESVAAGVGATGPDEGTTGIGADAGAGAAGAGVDTTVALGASAGAGAGTPGAGAGTTGAGAGAPGAGADATGAAVGAAGTGVGVGTTGVGAGAPGAGAGAGTAGAALGASAGAGPAVARLGEGEGEGEGAKQSSWTPVRPQASSAGAGQLSDYVYLLGTTSGPLPDPRAIGAKAYGLARIARAGLRVPEAAVLKTSLAGARAERLIDEESMKDVLVSAVRALEARTGLRLGSARAPLLLSVRSGAPVSMPGMLETVLDVGICDECTRGMITLTGNPRLAWDSYRRFIESFAAVVHDCPRGPFEQAVSAQLQAAEAQSPRELSARALEELTHAHMQRFAQMTGAPLPQDPLEQLRAAVEAVLRSWGAPKAGEYRRLHDIPDAPGTAVILQRMVFGNAGGLSGAGVGFTRDPALGERGLYMDFMFDAQGEDVVGGRHRVQGAEELARVAPEVLAEIEEVCPRLEAELGDAQEFELTVQEGELFLLQARTAMRTPWAALRIATDQVREGLISPATGLERLSDLDLSRLRRRHVQVAEDGALCHATPASIGVASGPVALDRAAAERIARAGTPPVLVRPDAVTEDLAAIAIAAGLLTKEGSRTSHAAVVARELDKPCLVGCSELELDLATRTVRIDGRQLAEGETICLDAESGLVFAGAPAVIEERPTRELGEVRAWRADVGAADAGASSG